MALWLKVLLAVAAITVIVEAAGPFLWHFTQGFVEGFNQSIENHPGLPSCESAHGLADARRAVDESLLGKMLGIKVVIINQPITLSAPPESVQCRANITLTVGPPTQITYTFTHTDDPSGAYLIHASLKDADGTWGDVNGNNVPDLKPQRSDP